MFFQDDEIQLKNNMKNQDFINSVQVIYLELKNYPIYSLLCLQFYFTKYNLFFSDLD